MKKLMVAAAIVCAAACVQAASVVWSTGPIKTYGTNGEGWGGSNISGDGYLATLYIYTDVAGQNQVAELTGNTDSTISKNALNGTASSEYLTFAAQVAGGTSYYAQLIVTKGDSSLTSEIVKFTGFGDAASPVNMTFVSGTGFSDTKPKGTYGYFPDAGWQSVPEPTSGLLLLLGVAGLALRRRRA